MCFLYDERSNADHMKFLIDDGMKECHGPALWVHNNAVFSDTDFSSITKLGGATKEKEVVDPFTVNVGWRQKVTCTDTACDGACFAIWAVCVILCMKKAPVEEISSEIGKKTRS